jgi:hypothetical protein
MKQRTQIRDLATTGRTVDPAQLQRIAGGLLPGRTYEPDVTYDGRQCRVDGRIEVDVTA